MVNGEFSTIAAVRDRARARARLWGTLILNRDGGDCRVCGHSAAMPGGQAHHIVPFTTICRRVEAEARRDGVDLDTPAGLDELYRRITADHTYRSLANGVQLCEVCGPDGDHHRISAETLRRLVPEDPDLPVFFDEPDADARIAVLRRERPMRPWVRKTRRRGPVRVYAWAMVKDATPPSTPTDT